MPFGKNGYNSNFNMNQTQNLKEDIKNEIISNNRENIPPLTDKPENFEKIKTLIIRPKHRVKSLYSLETDETSKVNEKMNKTKLKSKKVFVSE